MMGVHALFKGPRRGSELERLDTEQVRVCRKCRLRDGATQTVFGRGDPHARLMFIGEGPGAEEDRQGIPFVGPAGKLLDRMICAMGMAPDEVYIGNIIKCRAPGNRDPRPDEIESCMPYLERQIELIEPEIICTLGLPASKTLLQSNKSMGQLRGRWFNYGGIALLPTYHPAYLLRSPGQKKQSWKDLKKIIVALTEGPPQVGGLF